MEQLENLTPQEYIGLADALAELAQQWERTYEMRGVFNYLEDK